MISAARFALFVLLFVGLSVPIYLGTALAELLAPGAIHRGARLWGRTFRSLVRGVLGIRLVVEGTVPRGPVIVAAKHQSLYETLVLLVLLDSPAIVFKRALLGIPFWHFFARRHGAMPVDRDDGAAAGAGAIRAMLRAGRAAAAAGRVILIFPEGTRVRPGEAPPLKPGVSALYQLLRLPVVPLALDSGCVWPSGRLPRPGALTFAFQEPIPIDLPRAAFEDRLHAAINIAMLVPRPLRVAG